jgi:hypothetical protein
MPNSFPTHAALPESKTPEMDNEETFRPPLGLKLFLLFFALLGGIILVDTVTRFFR